jgi:hypothetical protein
MNKKDVKTIGDIERYYSQCRKIKFENNVEVKSISDIKQYLLEKKYKTLFTRGKLHCIEDKSRSIDDFFILCKYYFPDKTIKQCVKELLDSEKIQIEEKKSVFYIQYCGNIKKTNSAGVFSGSYRQTNIEYKKHFKLNLGFNIYPTFEKILKYEEV